MAKEEAVQSNPFPGLRPFDYEQHDLFFGREEQVGFLLQRLEENRFLTVLGQSGSGKSSLIRAGMLPQLHAGQLAGAGDVWEMAIFHPGRSAIDSMTEAFRKAGLAEAAGVQELKQSAGGLTEAARMAGIGTGRNLLIVVDQFEELFRLQEGDDAGQEGADLFVRQLLNAAEQRELPIYVALTMRAEFIGHCNAFSGLTEMINEADYLIPRMSREQLRAAIEKPVAAYRATIDAELTECLLAEIGDETGQLPVVQHALMRTWDYWQTHRREGESLEIGHYEAVGTIHGALSLHAEEVFGELPDDEARQIAEVAFKCLASDLEGLEGGRQPTTLGEIAAVAGVEREKAGNVIDHFRRPGCWFLTPPPDIELEGDTVVDIAHETLVRLWERAQTWIEEEEQSARLYLRLASTAALYQEGRAGLYQDPDLELALEWGRQHRPTVAWGQRYDPAFERAMTFLEHSRKDRDFQLAKKEERVRKQLRRTRFFALMGGGASLVFLLFLLFALNLYFAAEESKKEAIDQKERAETERQNAERQRQIAVEQQQVAVTERQNAEEQRQIAVEQQQVAVTERQNAEEQRQIAVEQQQVAVTERQNAEEQRQIAVEQKLEAERLRLLSVARSLAVQATKIQQRAEEAELGVLLALQGFRFNARYGGSALDPDIYNALRLASGSFDTGQSGLMRGHGDDVRDMAFSADGRRLASGSDDGLVLLWDLERGTSRTLHRGEDGVRSVVFDADRDALIGGTVEGRVLIWTLNGTATRPEVLVEPTEGNQVAISSLVLQPGGSLLAIASLDGRVRLWDLERRTELELSESNFPGRVHTVAFSPDGSLLSAGCGQGEVRLWDMGDRAKVPVALSSGRLEVLSLAFSADERWLAAGTGNGDILIWDREDLGRSPIVLIGHQAGVTSIDFHPDSELLVSGSLDRMVRIWNVRKRGEEPILIEHDAWVWSVSFSPQGDRLISGGADKNVHLWTTRSEQIAGQLSKTVGRNMTLKEWQSFVGEDIPYEKTRADLPGEIEQ